jgi:hypothetical protein
MYMFLYPLSIWISCQHNLDLMIPVLAELHTSQMSSLQTFCITHTLCLGSKKYVSNPIHFMIYLHVVLHNSTPAVGLHFVPNNKSTTVSLTQHCELLYNGNKEYEIKASLHRNAILTGEQICENAFFLRIVGFSFIYRQANFCIMHALMCSKVIRSFVI